MGVVLTGFGLASGKSEGRPEQDQRPACRKAEVGAKLVRRQYEEGVFFIAL